MKHIVLAIALLAASATAAGAQEKARGTSGGDAHKSKKSTTASAQQPAKKKPVFFDFTGDNIDGDRIRPDGTTIFGLRAARHGSLIKLRGDFLREIVKSGERL